MSSAAGTGGSAAYQISALGQRVMKQLPEASTVFHYDREGRIIAESDAADNVMREYLWLGELPIAYFDGTSLYYVHTDHLGTPRLLAGGTGAPVWRWEGPPFGEGAADEDPDGNGVQVSYNLRFPGQYFDKETNLHYNYFRDYDPAIGRYIQSDPIGLRGGINTYAYVENKPLSSIDPTGEAGITFDMNFQAMIAAFGAKSAFGFAFGNNICFKVETCGRVGIGAALGMNITGGYTSGELCTKVVDATGVFATGGLFLGGLSGVKGGSRPSLSASIGGGPILGAAGGIDACRIQYFCLLNRPCGCEDNSPPRRNIGELVAP